jgi:aryl-alcohol dehydrogenase-like predicted oxidoreductase
VELDREPRRALLVSGRGGFDIRRRRFGQTDLQVSEFGLGCARLGGVFKSGPAEFERILTSALDAGINFFDTAAMYSQGESEALIGRTFRRRREEVIIASKAGWVLPSQQRFIARLKPLIRPIIGALKLSRRHLPGAARGTFAQDFSPPYLRKSLEGSLRRLRTDRLDLFQLHSPPLEVVEPAEWIETLETLKREGKIRYYGVSCDVADATLAALGHTGLSSIQVPLSLLERAAVPALPIAKAKGVGVIVRESLANGLLVKDLTVDEIRRYCESDEEASAKAARVRDYRQTAADSGCSLSQLALRYVSGLDGVSVTLVGVSRLEQLEAFLTNGLGHVRTGAASADE